MAEGDVSLLVTRLTSYGSCPYRRCSMSFASLLRADRRENGRVEHDEWHAVDAARIEEVISRMDQRRHTETALEGRDWWLALIGGGSGAYIVSIENRMTGVRFELVDPRQSQDQVVEVVAGGQRGHLSARDVVGREAAVRAARHFAETGEPDPGLDWVEERGA